MARLVRVELPCHYNFAIFSLIFVKKLKKKNTLSENLTSVMHQCVKNCSIKRKQIINPNNTAKCWWSRECSINKSRNRLFHYIWKESGRPRTGVVYECYKLAKKNFRRACRQAINNHSKGRFLQIDKLYKARSPEKMWNCIKLTKKQNVNYDAISLNQLENHYLTKFGCHRPLYYHS